MLAASWARGATLQGSVSDPSGQLVAGARVTLLAHQSPLDDRRTGPDGGFRFENLPPGEYQIVAIASGLTFGPEDLKLSGSENRRLDLTLKLSAVTQQVVVSASAGGALAAQIGSSVSVVTAQQIKNTDAQSVDEVLREVPGVSVLQTGRRGGLATVFVRGGNSNYNLISLDGIPLNEFGGDFDFSSLAADDIEQLEVVRGPESALYGSNAVTSVINIQTPKGSGPPRFSLLQEGGSFDTFRSTVSTSGLTRGIGWAVNTSRLSSNGVVTNDRYLNQSATVSLDFSRSPKRQASLHFFGDANDAGSPGPYGTDPDQFFGGIDTYSRDKQNLFGYSGSFAEQFTPRLRQVTTGSIAVNDYYFRTPYGDSFVDNLRGVLNTRSEIVVSNEDTLVAGFEFNREQVRDTYITDANDNPFTLPRSDYAFFAENRWNPLPRLFLNAGLRVDDFHPASLPPGSGTPALTELTLAKVDPRISAAFLARESDAAGWLGVTRLHASYGTGIREPNGFELAFTDNPHLKPEVSLSFDAGVEQRFYQGRAVLDLTYFYNRFKNQIVTLGGSLTNLSTFVSDNLGNSRAQGMEATVRLRPTRSLQVSGSYTLLNTAILALNGSSRVAAPFYVGEQLIRRPKNTGIFGATWQKGRLILNGNGLIRGSELDLEPNLGTYACTLGLPCLFTNKGYTLVNAGLAIRVTTGLEFYGRFSNIFNQKYEDAFGYPSLHFNYMAGVRFSFPRD
jgi:outer membrane cobalamin receptor